MADANPVYDGPTGLEEAVARFEKAWQRGELPSIDAFLPEGDGRAAALLELAHAELELRIKAGEPARVEEYQARYPDLQRDPAALLGLIAAECRLRQRREPDLAFDEYLRRFPEYRADLAAMLQTVPLAPTPPASLSPTPRFPTLPGYEILGVLGRGGMGVVYHARQRRPAGRSARRFSIKPRCAASGSAGTGRAS